MSEEIRTFRSYPVADIRKIKWQMLNWCARFNICSFLDNHEYELPQHSYECLAGVGLHEGSNTKAVSLDTLDSLLRRQDWCFGHLSYDLKNELEGLQSRHPDYIGFPDLTFYIPETVLLLRPDRLDIGTFDQSQDRIAAEIMRENRSFHVPQPVSIRSRLSRLQYIERVEALRQHILRGDCYEINFCQEFFAEHAHIDPPMLYHLLSVESPNPFSAYYRLHDSFLLCASPERYLKISGTEIRSQPIKGTSRRMRNDLAQDERVKRALRESAKDRAENVMVVDLVRNDLAKVCEQGSVVVEELFGIYSFPQVHQMISTIRGVLRKDVSFADIIRATFPMGSMTGAPKRRVMELIDRYELSRRGLYSGAVGYIDPQGNADFNVVIRSILYHSGEGYLSYQVGSGITFASDAEAEYEECLLKAAAIEKILQEGGTG